MAFDPEYLYGGVPGAYTGGDASPNIVLLPSSDSATPETSTTEINWPKVVFSILICIIGLVGNTVVIFVILVLKEYKKSVTHWYVLQLAVADSLFLLTLPFKSSEDINKMWIYPEWMCKAKESLLFLNYYASVTFLMIMSIDRYIAVCHTFSDHLQKLRKPASAVAVTLLVWIVCLCLCIPTMLFTHTVGTHPSCSCSYIFPSKFDEVVRKSPEESCAGIPANLQSFCLDLFTEKEGSTKYCRQSKLDLSQVFSKLGPNYFESFDAYTDTDFSNFGNSTNTTQTTNQTEGTSNKTESLPEIPDFGGFGTSLDLSFYNIPGLEDLGANPSSPGSAGLPPGFGFPLFSEAPPATYIPNTTVISADVTVLGSGSSVDTASPSLTTMLQSAARATTPKTSSFCNYNSSPDGWKWFLGFNFVVMYILPIVVMVVSYGLIVRKLSSTKFRSDSTVSMTQSNGKKRKTSTRSDKDRRRVTIMCASLVSTFVLLWLPFHVAHLARIVGINVSYEMSYICENLPVAGSLLAYLNSALNPYLYSFLGSNFKRRWAHASSTVRKSVKRRTSSVSGSFGVKYTRKSKKPVRDGSTSNTGTVMTKVYRGKSGKDVFSETKPSMDSSYAVQSETHNPVTNLSSNEIEMANPPSYEINEQIQPLHP